MADEISNLLESRKGLPLKIKLRSGKIVTGILQDFDIHMTMNLESAVEEYATVDESGKKHTHKEEIGTVLLRGDNILTISIPDEEHRCDDDDGS